MCPPPSQIFGYATGPEGPSIWNRRFYIKVVESYDLAFSISTSSQNLSPASGSVKPPKRGQVCLTKSNICTTRG